ncbi:MAG: class I SAM-dependent methyltransferase [Gammaproteobacteria bacterium]
MDLQTYQSASSKAASDISICPSCENGEMQVFYEAKSVPANSCILLSSQEEAKSYPRGDVRLGFCPECGFISNVAFNAQLTEYSGRYEETQGFSSTFNSFHKALAQRMIERYDLHEKDIIEIGCGKGEFLLLLCEMGNNRGTGFDPGFVEERIDSPAADRIHFVKDFYSEKYTSYQGDFVCCKMTLEHIHPTAEFIKTVRRSIGNRLDTVIFFQIPDTTRIINDCAFEDIYYEHCSYFTPGSLARLFRRCGFEVIALATEYDGQYLTIEARPAPTETGTLPPLAEESDLDALKQGVRDFPDKFAEKRRFWERRLGHYVSEGKKVVLWGSGSKGVSFLTTLKVPDELQYVVDINPYRKGYFMSGTGHQIVGPEFLKDYQPDIVIVMNGIYCNEIGNDLGKMGLHPEIISL